MVAHSVSCGLRDKSRTSPGPEPPASGAHPHPLCRPAGAWPVGHAIPGLGPIRASGAFPAAEPMVAHSVSCGLRDKSRTSPGRGDRTPASAATAPLGLGPFGPARPGLTPGPTFFRAAGAGAGSQPRSGADGSPQRELWVEGQITDQPRTGRQNPSFGRSSPPTLPPRWGLARWACHTRADARAYPSRLRRWGRFPAAERRKMVAHSVSCGLRDKSRTSPGRGDRTPSFGRLSPPTLPPRWGLARWACHTRADARAYLLSRLRRWDTSPAAEPCGMAQVRSNWWMRRSWSPCSRTFNSA